MEKKYDVIVIGGGHNGLTAAITLARKGKNVLVLEKNKHLGGIARGSEFAPGFFSNGLLHDTSCVRTQVIKALDLVKYGLSYEASRPDFAILSKDGQRVLISGNIEDSVKNIATISQSDAEAYQEYYSFIKRISSFLTPLLNEIPPNLMNFGPREILALARRGWGLKKLGKKTMNEFLKVAPMCVADFLNEKFETDFLKAGLCAPSVYGSFTGPWSSYTTLNLLMHECTSAVHIPGGPKKLVEVLEKAAISNGVKIETNSEVKRIEIDSQGKASGVVLKNGDLISAPTIMSSTTPKKTFLNLIEPFYLDHPFEHNISHYRSRGTTAKLNLAINKSISFKWDTSEKIAYARTGNSFDEMEKAFDAVKYGQFSEDPILDIAIPTKMDRSLAPEGASVISVIAHFAPYHLKKGWNEKTRSKLKDSILSSLRKYLELDEDDIVGTQLLTPLDLETEYNLEEGHIYHGEHAVDQIFTRPIPECARYDTPFDGLYLCGSGSHPGGGITCAPGYLAAQRVLTI